MDYNLKLNETEGEFLEDPSQYRRIIGRLMYLTISRPGIVFTVNKLSQFMTAPRAPHLQAINHVLQYLKPSPGQGLMFSASPSLSLSAYDDADWGSCTTTRKPTTGFCIFIGLEIKEATC